MLLATQTVCMSTYPIPLATAKITAEGDVRRGMVPGEVRREFPAYVAQLLPDSGSVADVPRTVGHVGSFTAVRYYARRGELSH